MTAECYAHINEHPETFHSQDLVNQLNSIERNNAGQVMSRNFTDMFMATCFAAYVRKMKELDILPQLNYSSDAVNENNFKNLKSVIETISPLEYTKKELIKEDIIRQNLINGEEDYIPPEEEEIFHLPFFYK